MSRSSKDALERTAAGRSRALHARRHRALPCLRPPRRSLGLRRDDANRARARRRVDHDAARHRRPRAEPSRRVRGCTTRDENLDRSRLRRRGLSRLTAVRARKLAAAAGADRRRFRARRHWRHHRPHRRPSLAGQVAGARGDREPRRRAAAISPQALVARARSPTATRCSRRRAPSPSISRSTPSPAMRFPTSRLARSRRVRPISSSPTPTLNNRRCPAIIAAARDEPFAFGSAGIGTTPHLTGERIFRVISPSRCAPRAFHGRRDRRPTPPWRARCRSRWWRCPPPSNR